MRLAASGKTDVGLRRETNEDRTLIDMELGLLVVADGMGGHAAGEVAAHLAVQGVASCVRSRQSELKAVRWGPDSARVGVDLMTGAANKVCQDVYSLSQSAGHLRGMGTTLTAVLVVGHTAIVAHVGDSRLYLRRGGTIRQVTRDHTLADEMSQKGMAADEVKANHRFAHMLVRAVGQEPPVEIETHVLDLLPGDTLLLCTDGLSNYLNNAHDLIPLLSGDCEEAACRLVDYALEHGGGDNISAIVATLSPAVAPGYEPTCADWWAAHGALLPSAPSA